VGCYVFWASRHTNFDTNRHEPQTLKHVPGTNRHEPTRGILVIGMGARGGGQVGEEQVARVGSDILFDVFGFRAGEGDNLRKSFQYTSTSLVGNAWGVRDMFVTKPYTFTRSVWICLCKTAFIHHATRIAQPCNASW
jgi:hypothetical protein